jgi:hypothetical protein
VLQSDNQTPFVTSLAIYPDETGIDSVYPTVKATFALGRTLSVAKEQVPLVMADEYVGEPGLSSLKAAAEIMPLKPSTDVLMFGNAHAEGGREVTSLDVSVSVQGRSKTVRVFGDRAWENGFFGARISDAEPFVTMPLTFESAFGGADVVQSDQTAVAFDYNPVGRGYRHKKGSHPLAGFPLPNLEDPSNLIGSPNQTAMPSAFGPSCANWQPRLQYAGTYDERWQKERAPYLPEDFDLRYFSMAAPELTFSPYLKGGEQVVIENASPNGRLEFSLPRLSLEVDLRIAGESHRLPLVVETVCIEPDQDRLTIVWKSKRQIDKQVLKLELATFRVQRIDSRNVKL